MGLFSNTVIFYAFIACGFIGFYLSGVSLLDFYRKQHERPKRFKMLAIGLILFLVGFYPAWQEANVFKLKASFEENK